MKIINDVYNKKIILYHGGSNIVRIPDLSMSRVNVDFGPGFYLTPIHELASKWACTNVTSICNEYTLNLTDLKVYEFQLDEEWLQFVIKNRSDGIEDEKYKDYDVLIGPIADDKLFRTIDMYQDGLLSTKSAIKIMNCMDYGKQYVLKTQRAVEELHYESHVKFQEKDQRKYRNKFHNDGKEAGIRTKQLIQEEQRKQNRLEEQEDMER